MRSKRCRRKLVLRIWKLRVMYSGKNRNNANIFKSSVEKALPTLYNVPIVAHWIRDENTIGGHDSEFVENEDGNIVEVNLTEPCGVVPESATFSFSEEADDNGIVREWLVIDNVLLWKRQDVYNHIMNDLGGVVSHSMEINVTDGHKNKATGFYDVYNFEFEALCLLEDCLPCFKGSQLEMYSSQNAEFKEKLSNMMDDLREMYSLQNKCEKEKGGVSDMENETKEFTAEAEKSEASGVAENYELLSNLYDSIYRAIDVVKLDTEFGTFSRYCIADTDIDTKMVYVWDRMDWLLYGIPYEMNGDNVAVCFDCKKRMKYAIVEFDEGAEQGSPFAGAYSDAAVIFSELKEKYDNVEASLHSAEESIVSMNCELDELRTYRATTESDKKESQVNAVFSQFEDLAGDSTFESLKCSYGEMSVEDIEDKCYAIRGRKMSLKYSAEKATAPKIMVSQVEEKLNNAPYGGIVDKFTK